MCIGIAFYLCDLRLMFLNLKILLLILANAQSWSLQILLSLTLLSPSKITVMCILDPLTLSFLSSNLFYTSSFFSSSCILGNFSYSVFEHIFSSSAVSFLSFFFFLFWPHLPVCGILFPQPGIEPRPLAVKTQSPNHWTAREFPLQLFLICSFSKLLGFHFD